MISNCLRNSSKNRTLTSKNLLTAKHEIKPGAYAFQGAFYTSVHFAFLPFFFIMERSSEEEFSFFGCFPFLAMKVQMHN